MYKLVAAAMIAASALAAPAVLTPASAIEIDCTDPASPGNRPGGFCSQSGGSTSSLSTPVTAPPPPAICTADAGTFLLPKGARVHVAIVATEYLLLC